MEHGEAKVTNGVVGAEALGHQGNSMFTRNAFVPVNHDGDALSNAWAGGLNSGQFSRIDLNGDGVLDLVVFDRIGNRLLPFVNTNSNEGQIQYTHDYAYVGQFPDLTNWALFRDYNCDGLVDIFTNESTGIRVYKNTSEGAELSFELASDELFASYDFSGNPFDASVYNLSIDLPSIQDHDGDGDLDIFTWGETATLVYYYHNNSVETWGTRDSLNYELGNRCYGQFSESSESFDLMYGDDFNCDFNVIDPRGSIANAERDGQHAGGALLQLDLDQNGIKDLVISDIADDYMIALLQEEDEDLLDRTFERIDFFPTDFTDDEIIDYETFPAAFYEDVNNDGVSDLISSPNGVFACIDKSSSWLYINEGSEDAPEFMLSQKDFLQDEMIDMGRSAYPVLLDYNQDGLIDLMVANHQNYVNPENKACRWMLMKNTGTIEYPAFTIVDEDYMNLESLGYTRSYPAFGDLDNDGDEDMIVGQQDGTFSYYRNDAATGEDANYVLVAELLLDTEGEDLDVGQVATPQLFDVDQDGLLDILSGEKNGNVNYIRNAGSPEVPAFEYLIDTIGNVVAETFLGVEGYSVPFMWKNQDEELELLIANELGYIQHYTDIEDNLDGNFNLESDHFGQIWEGTYAGVCMYDFTNDGKLDLIYGQVGGGLAFYQGGDSITVDVEEFADQSFFHLYPNPSHGRFVLELEDWSTEHLTVQVFDASGRLIHSQQYQGPRHVLGDDSWEAGVYMVHVQQGNLSHSQSVILLKN